jgi:tetratricopeptide (TPR) repeat protein
VTPEVGLTTQTSAPYNRLAMPVNDQAIVGAIRRHEERLARDPASLAFAQLADLYRKAGRTRDAVALCRDGLARYPHYTTARLILAKALAADEQLAAALVELNAILEVSPKDLQGHLLSAEVHRRLGHIDEAVKHLEAAADLDPGDRESRALLSLLRAAAPSSGEAAGLARLLRDDTFATVTFGSLCLEQGCVEEAVQVFTRILRKDPDHREARDRLESALRARQRRKG